MESSSPSSSIAPAIFRNCNEAREARTLTRDQARSRSEISVLVNVLSGVSTTISTTVIEPGWLYTYLTCQSGPTSGEITKSPDSNARAIALTATLFLIGREKTASTSAARLTPSARKARATLSPCASRRADTIAATASGSFTLRALLSHETVKATRIQPVTWLSYKPGVLPLVRQSGLATPTVAHGPLA